MATNESFEEPSPAITIDDIFVIMIARNLKDGRSRASHSVLSEFFARLRFDSVGWASKNVQEALRCTQPEDIDNMMVRVFNLSEGCSFVGEVGDDTCVMYEQQIQKACEDYDRLSEEDKKSVSAIAKLYGRLLAKMEG